MEYARFMERKFEAACSEIKILKEREARLEGCERALLVAKEYLKKEFPTNQQRGRALDSVVSALKERAGSV